jgi:putative DNA primase/helicase
VSSTKAATRYIERGWCPVPIPRGEKGPQLAGWQNLRLTAQDVPRYFTNGQNVGIINGDASGGLVTVDLDCPEAVATAGRFLEPTLTSGRESVPDSHWWYVSPGLEHRKFEGILKTASEGTILELRSTDHQTVVEPSVHPSGERYRWSRSGLEPLEISADALTTAGRHLATTALIAHLLPESKDRGGGGGRYHYALALAGYLLRHDLDPETVEALLKAAWDAKGWHGIERHRRSSYAGIERAVRDTAEKLRRDAPATGGRTLEGMVQGLPRKIADFLGWERFSLREGRKAYLCTDAGNAERLADRHGANLRYCYPWGKWLGYDGARWVVDDRGAVVRLAKETVRAIFEEAQEAPDDERAKQLGKWAISSQSESKIKAMIALGQSEPGVPVLPEEMDASRHFLNVLNGTIDLRTGELREHRREHLITKLAPVAYDPAADAPTWRAALERVLPDSEIREFFKRLCGYALTGDTSEHILPMLFGTGANGKSTVLNALLDTLGDYATQAAPDLLITKKNSHPTELADLFGMRFVASIEVEDGRRLAESLVKQLTGGDRIKARKMRQDFWEFEPTHKVFMAVNHKPTVRGTDNAIWRRIRLIPFTETIPPGEQDKKLPEKLRSERSGILAWAVEGCLEWEREGLQAPEEVRKATGEYRAEMDVLGAFLKECCKQSPEENEAAGELYKAYKLWCEDGGERAETQRRFGSQLRDRGFERYRGGSDGGNRWRGLSLLTLWKERICRDSDRTDPKVTFGAKKNDSREGNSNLGSEGSEGSVNLSVEDVLGELRREGSGPARAYSHYLEMPSDQRLGYLVKAVLVARKLGTAGWERYRPVVLEASAQLEEDV